MNLEFDFITPFYLGAKDVFEQLFYTKVNVSNIHHVEIDKNISDVTVVFDLTGQNFMGKVFYFMPKSFVLSVLSILIGPMTEFDLSSEMTKSAILELNNMITGKALMKLSDMGSNYNMSVPQIIEGVDVQISDEKLSLSMVTLKSESQEFSIGFLTSNIGAFYVRVSKENDPELKPKAENKELLEFNDNFLSEIKNITLKALNEIKDLKGDNEFLVRKNTAVANLANVLLVHHNVNK